MYCRLNIYDALEGRNRVVKIRGKLSICSVCGSSPSITNISESEAWIRSNNLYVCYDDTLDRYKYTMASKVKDDELVSVEVYNDICKEAGDHVLLDVRDTVQYDICHLPHARNLPLSNLNKEALAALIIDINTPSKYTYIII